MGLYPGFVCGLISGGGGASIQGTEVDTDNFKRLDLFYAHGPVRAYAANKYMTIVCFINCCIFVDVVLKGNTTQVPEELMNNTTCT